MQHVLNLPNLSLEKQRPPERYTKRSRAHPAKLYTPIAVWGIEKYTRVGDWVLDPMAGIGTVPVEAITLGRQGIGVEYERPWYDEMEKNVERAKNNLGGAVWGNAYLGDARYMNAFIGEGPFDLIMFSPPYDEVISVRKKDEGGHAVKLLKKIQAETGMWPVPREVLREYANKWREDVHEGKEEGKYSMDPNNVGNMSIADYDKAMVEIYVECMKQLAHGGHMAVVTRNYCRQYRQVRFDLRTIDLCQQAGWNFKERWYAPIYRYSYWTSKYKQKCEAKGLKNVVPEYDDILVFEVP